AHALVCCGMRRARGGPHGDSVRGVSCWRRDDANSVWILPRAGWGCGAVFLNDHRAKTFHGANAIRDGDSHDGGAAFAISFGDGFAREVVQRDGPSTAGLI